MNTSRSQDNIDTICRHIISYIAHNVDGEIDLGANPFAIDVTDFDLSVNMLLDANAVLRNGPLLRLGIIHDFVRMHAFFDYPGGGHKYNSDIISSRMILSAEYLSCIWDTQEARKALLLQLKSNASYVLGKIIELGGSCTSSILLKKCRMKAIDLSSVLYFLTRLGFAVPFSSKNNSVVFKARVRCVQ